MSGPESLFLEEDPLHLRLLVMDYRPIDIDWNAVDVCSPYWRLYVNSRDGAAVEWARGRHAIRGGHVHLIPAWVRFSCLCTARLDHFYLHCDPLFLPGALVRACFATPLGLPPLPAVDALAAEAIARQRGEPQALATRAVAKALAFTALAAACDRLPAAQRARLGDHRRATAGLRSALTLIEDRLSSPLANRQLAASCGLSEDHFIRVFRAALGQTPAQYVQERRIATAAQHLVAGADPIPEIAERCGFGDRFYFTRVFTRRVGIPPAAYRRRGRI